MIQSISPGENLEVLEQFHDEELGLSECLIGSRTTIYFRPAHIGILEHLVERLKAKRDLADRIAKRKPEEVRP